MISRWNDKAAAASRMALGVVFIIAALLKWFDPAHQSTYYGSLAHASPMIGWAIVAGELLLGAWLVSGFRTGLAAGAALFMLAIFSGAIIADMLAKHPIPCGCFGAAWAAAHSPAAIEHGLATGLIRDAVFILLAGSVLFCRPRAEGENRLADGQLGGGTPAGMGG
jgi:uncharacterized membrane protein YphA (DoxX/SURF4 family)